jgi:hypothetical protein
VSGWQFNTICHASEQFPFYTADWLKSIRKRRHQNPRPAFAQACVLGAVDRASPRWSSLFKSTAIGERTDLQFRAEFFNVLNHGNFGTPNATVFLSGAFSLSAGLITTTASRQIQCRFEADLRSWPTRQDQYWAIREMALRIVQIKP